MRLKNKTIRFIEFFLIGVVMGVAEDLLAIKIATDAAITVKVIVIIFLVALPFAFISEYIVDHPRFWKTVLRMKDEEIENENDLS